MNNKVLVKLYVPIIEEQYDVWLPLNKKIRNVTLLLIKAVKEFSDGAYNPTEMPSLYNRVTSDVYNVEAKVHETGIRNGTEVILI